MRLLFVKLVASWGVCGFRGVTTSLSSQSRARPRCAPRARARRRCSASESLTPRRGDWHGGGAPAPRFGRRVCHRWRPHHTKVEHRLAQGHFHNPTSRLVTSTFRTLHRASGSWTLPPSPRADNKTVVRPLSRPGTTMRPYLLRRHRDAYRAAVQSLDIAIELRSMPELPLLARWQ